MKKLVNVVIPIIFILLGILCLTVTSTVFHSHNSIHTYIESFLGVCVFMVIPFAIILIYYFLRKKDKKNSY